jgi:hypothetical protein
MGTPTTGATASSGVCVEALDLCIELMRRFGSLPDAAKFHGQLLAACVAHLGNAVPLARKRASAAAAALAPVASDDLLQVCACRGGLGLRLLA